MLTEQIASLPISAAKQSVQTMDNCSLQRTLHNLNESRVISNSFCQASLVIFRGALYMFRINLCMYNKLYYHNFKQNVSTTKNVDNGIRSKLCREVNIRDAFKHKKC